MAPERLILCSGAHAAGRRPNNAIDLDAYGPVPNGNFKLESLRRTLWTEIPPLLRDLLDVAIYAYVADQAVPRCNGGRLDGAEPGAGWRRALRLRVPVREPDRWNAPAVRGALETSLGFVSEDEWVFEFPHLTRDFPLAERLDFHTTPFHGSVQEVVLFSGGLDSLAGAVHEALVEHKQVLLVNHRSTEKLTPTHESLVRDLIAVAGPRAPLHTPVWVNKRKRLGRETTQRTRSFLFAALGAVFARMIGLSRVRFYENGVTSLNLPPVG